DALGVAERLLEGVAAGILLDRDQSRYATAFGEDLAHSVAGSLGRDERDVNSGGRGNGAEADIEAVGEHQGLAGREVGLDVGVVDLGGGLVRREVHDDVGPFAHVGYGIDYQPGFARAVHVGRV